MPTLNKCSKVKYNSKKHLDVQEATVSLINLSNCDLYFSVKKYKTVTAIINSRAVYFVMWEKAYGTTTDIAALQLQPKLGQTVLVDKLETYILVFYILLVIRFSHYLLVVFHLLSYNVRFYTSD